MTRMLCDLLIIGQITKDKMLHLHIFPSLSFSFPSLPSSSSSFSPFLLARGRACEQREPGSHPVSTSPGFLPTPKGRRQRKAPLGRPLSPGPGVLTLSHLQSPESPSLPHPERSSLNSLIPSCLELPRAPCVPQTPATRAPAL